MWPGFRKLPNAKSFNVEAAQPYVLVLTLVPSARASSSLAT